MELQSELRVVITGGPCSGKTTVIEALAARGFRVVPEAAIEVIAELSERLGVEGQKRWRSEHREAFQVLIIEKQAVLEAAASGGVGPLFHDRGRLDGLGYCRAFGAPVPPEVEAGCRELPYDRVFLLDTLSDFDGRAATGRTSDRERSLMIRDELMRTYTEYGLPPVFVPETSVEERLELILADLE
ncbi:MAG: ATP-binding protein [Planctomycetota bacterium]|nr:ATP-binding protein [Planctomycetota bacterium]